jgi:DNA-binding NarL/FixJ family response regulator
MEIVVGRIKKDPVHTLLSELAEVRSRLDRVLIDSSEQRRLVAASCSALRKTVKGVRQTVQASASIAALFGQAPKQTPPPRVEFLKHLTPREIEVLRLIAEGLSTKEIASHLDISFKTVVSHRTHLLEKLGIHESATLVRLAVRAGLVAA